MSNFSYKEFLEKIGGRNVTEYGYYEHLKYYLKNYKHFLPKDKNAQILDIGCGLGHFLYFCLHLGYKNVTGVDISTEMVEYCQKKFPYKILKINSLIDFLQEKKISYDFIVMNDVLEHIPKEEIIPAIKAIYHALTSRGKVVIKTINAANILSGWTRYGDFTHTISFTEWSLFYILRNAGFEKNKIQFYSEKYVYRNFYKGLLGEICKILIESFTKFIFKVEKRYIPKITSPNIIVMARK